MRTEWKRFPLKAIILALLSLILFGCGSTISSPAAPAEKPVKGVVSDSTGGQPFANASVTAYAVDAVGNVSATPLSATVQSDGQGNFILRIPESYAGAIKLVATETTGTGVVVLNTVLPTYSQGQTALITPATELVYQYIVTNRASTFTPDNILKATQVVESFLGANSTQIPPPVIGTSPTTAQQQLVVVTEAINSLTSPTVTLGSLLTVQGNGLILLGQPATLANLNTAIGVTSGALIDSGAVAGTFTQPTITPVQEPDLTDKTAPTAPQNLTAAVTTSTVTLSWGAATDNVGVTSYYVFRDGVFVTSVATLSFTDSAVNSGAVYTYEVKARDAAGNLSFASNSVAATTTVIPTFTISGKVTLNGTGLASVFVLVSGQGSGIAVTDANGNYSLPGVRAGNYTVTPTITGFTFTPVTTSVVVTTANVTGVDFTATAVTPGSVNGGVTYPPGTIIGGISYPSGAVIGGVTYPTATVIGGVTYPTGTVIGGTTYPNGVVIGGVNYPAGTVVGGVAFPLGAVTTGLTLQSGTIVNGVTFTSGVVNGALIYSTGSVITNLNTAAFNVIVSGRVVNSVGAGLEGVPVSVVGTGGGSTVTGPLGYYYISVVSGNTYTITAPAASVATPFVLNGVSYTAFTPATIVITPTDVTTNSGNDFTATP